MLDESTVLFRECIANNDNKSNFETFFRNQSAIEAARYPFLSKTQIRQRIMAIWKKNSSQLGLKETKHGSKSIKKTSLKRNENFKDTRICENMTEKIPSKRSLVPLKVEFVPVSSKADKKGSCSKSKRKRRVSFNKELYIRYRTTSEESSGSTLKEKKKCNQNHRPVLRNFPRKYESYTNKNHNSSEAQKKDKSQMQCQFNNLLNKKCSWSYRSQKTIHKHNMEADTNSFNVQSTFLIEALQNGSNTESEESHKENKRDVSHQTNLEKNTRSASSENGSSKEKTKMLTNVEVLDKPESENVLEMSSEDNIELPRSNSKISRTHNDQGLAYENTESCNSSSDEEVFQTRFTVQEKTFIYEDDQISNKNSASPGKSFVKDRTPESNLETSNIFPMIIQAKAYESKENDPTNQINFEMKQEITSKSQEDKIDKVGGNSLSVETGNCNIEVENSSMKNSVEDNELRECNDKKDRNKISEDVKETENDNSLAQNAEESSDELANLVIQEFLNGSFDISAYQPERSSINIMEKSLISSNQSVNRIRPTNKRNISENNKYNKKPFELFMATKKTKNNFNNNMNEDDWFSNSHRTSTIDLKRKKSGRQTEDSKKAKIMTSRYRTRPKFITEKPKEINSKSSCKLDDKYLKAKKQRKVVNNRSFNLEKNINVLNDFGRKEQDIEKIKTKHNTVKTKSYKKEKISTQFSYHESPMQKNSRNKRNSSLIASQKIKAIEKLENRESIEEIYLELDDSNFDLSTMQTEDTYAKMLHHGKINHTLKSKNELNSDKICIQNISNISSNALQSNSPRMKNFENSRITRNKYKLFKDAFDTCNFIIKSPLKKNKRITNKYFTSDIDYSDNCFILENENENFNSRMKSTFKRKSKKNEISDIKNDISNEFLPCKNNAKNKIPFKNAETQCKQKTWDMLEKELLGELNGTQFTHNSSETVTVKKEKLVSKSNSKNSNLYTVSNRLTQTVSKSTEGNRYNMQYKLQNTESKYLETRTNNAYNYQSMFDRKQQREISNKQTNAIVEKTIAAMERCTAEFIKPEVDVVESVKKTDRLQFTDIIDGSDINKTEFHSNRTFMANENEQYIQNEIVSFLKKSTTRKKNKNSNRKGNISYNEKNCQDAEKEFGNSNHNEHLENSFVTTNCILDKNAEQTNENKNWALISLQEKQTNPWEKVMKELNFETDSDKDMHTRDTFKKLLPKTYTIKKNLDKEKNCKQDRIIDIENKVCKQMTINKEEILPSHTPETVNSTTTNIYTAEYTIESTRNFNKISKLDNESLTKVEKPMKKVPRNTKVNSPKFKLQLEKDGGLKFKKYCSKSSSSSLEKFIKSKPNTKHVKNECPNDNKGKKKYKKYVKKLFSTEDTLPKNSIITDDKTGSMKIQNINNEDFEDSKDKRKRMKNLISQNEEDFFSLSSSDSEMDNEKNQGSGLLFELFEE